MIKYVENSNDTLTDRETGLCIPKTGGNLEYREYLAWVAAGNTPIEAQPGPEYVLDGDAWVVDADLLESQEKATARAYLKSTDDLVRRYQEDVAAGRPVCIPESKYKNLLKKRARAQKKAVKARAQDNG